MMVAIGFYSRIEFATEYKVQIDLYSVSGQLMGTLHNGFLIKDTHALALNKKAIANGSYYLKITTKTATKTIQVTFQ